MFNMKQYAVSEVQTKPVALPGFHYTQGEL
jgi:hypothetical protein